MKPVLGIFPNLGDSFAEYQKSGRDSHWLNNYLRFYVRRFEPVYFFSYANEINPYPDLITLLPNRFSLPRWLYAWLMPFFYRRQLRQCRVLRVKQMPGVWPALIARFLWKIPIVVTYGYDYAYFAQKEGKWWLVPFFRLSSWLGWEFSDAVIVTTPSQHPKAFLLPNGVDVDLFKPRKKRHNIIIKILTVGRLVQQKNQLNLVRAVARLNRPAELTLVGRGPLKLKIFSLAKKLKVRLKYIESVAHRQLPKIYQSADIFCLPSHHEGNPKVLLEAMSCGLACVASDKPFSRFIITSYRDGLLVTNDSITLARGLALAAKNKKLGIHARQTILDRFDNQKIIDKELKLLTSLLR